MLKGIKPEFCEGVGICHMNLHLQMCLVFVLTLELSTQRKAGLPIVKSGAWLSDAQAPVDLS
jgi:hypothetical protein